MNNKKTEKKTKTVAIIKRQARKRREQKEEKKEGDGEAMQNQRKVKVVCFFGPCSWYAKAKIDSTESDTKPTGWQMRKRYTHDKTHFVRE